MSSKNELDRKAFHRRQMDALPMLISGLDPDPPVLLCSRTTMFDELVCQELRAAGWPASSKSDRARKADPPAPIKGSVLARKLAQGNDLSADEIGLLALRIAWLQRNWFRWSARNGYQHSAAFGAFSPDALTSADADAPARLSGEVARASRQADTEAKSEAPRDLFPNAPARDRIDLNQFQTQEREENTKPKSIAASGENEASKGMNEASMHRPERPSIENGEGASTDRFDAALASLGANSEDDNLPSFEDYGRVISEGGSNETDTRFIALRTGHINSVEGDKVRSFLFAIYYKEPLTEIERRARALAVDGTQLSDALSRGDSTSQDIREAFAKLGLDADA